MIMETLRVEIIYPKAKSLKIEFKELLFKLRSKSENALTLDNLTNEVEIVRASRYESKAKQDYY